MDQNSHFLFMENTLPVEHLNQVSKVEEILEARASKESALIQAMS